MAIILPIELTVKQEATWTETRAAIHRALQKSLEIHQRNEITASQIQLLRAKIKLKFSFQFLSV